MFNLHLVAESFFKPRNKQPYYNHVNHSNEGLTLIRVVQWVGIFRRGEYFNSLTSKLITSTVFPPNITPFLIIARLYLSCTLKCYKSPMLILIFSSFNTLLLIFLELHLDLSAINHALYKISLVLWQKLNLKISMKFGVSFSNKDTPQK